MVKHSEQELERLFALVLSKKAKTTTLSRLQLKLSEVKDKDELSLFRVLQRICKMDPELDKAFEEVGIGTISNFDPLSPDPNRGKLVQAFNSMYDNHRKDGAHSQRIKRPKARVSLVSEVKKTKGVAIDVIVHAGKDLVVKDILSSDPYCVLMYTAPGARKSQRFETAVQNRTLNPFWKEEFRFENVSKDGNLRIEVWDKDKIGTDDFMGEVEVDLAGVDFNKGLHEWFELQKVDTGQLRVRITPVND